MNTHTRPMAAIAAVVKRAGSGWFSQTSVASPHCSFQFLSESGTEPLLDGKDVAICQAVISTALISIFRGRFCDAILPNRKAVTFKKGEVIYNVGDRNRIFFFLQSGFVKVGTITTNGHELIYDVRTGGDLIGELCACEQERSDRAVALEQTDAIPVPFEEIMEVLLTAPDLALQLVNVFCQALKEAYAQVNTLAADDLRHRLAKALLRLATNIGQRAGNLTEIPTVLTQEEIAQMISARRERVSTAISYLRRRGMIQYTTRGHLALSVKALEGYVAR